MSATRRRLPAAVGVSLCVHAGILGLWSLTLGGRALRPAPLKPAMLLYEPPAAADHASRQGLRPRVQMSLPPLSLPSPASPLGQDAGGGESPLGQGLGAAAFPTTPGLGHEPVASHDGAWAAAVDLTNVGAAAQGNPVLYTYFSAIREQIQRTANAGTWLPNGQGSAGTVCIGFVLLTSGAVESLAVVTERSTPSLPLQDAARRIVGASGPFLPFPPSMREPSKTLVIPIEFASNS